MVDVLVDTDVFIDHLRGHRSFQRGQDRIHYSAVTRAELLATRNADEGVIRTLLAPFVELPVDRPTAERAGTVRRLHGISMAGALIAATALEHDLTVITRNIFDFAAVDGLRARQPE
jgi:predicted nucleic acid-binding protein